MFSRKSSEYVFSLARPVGLTLSVCVDDNLISGPCEDEVKREMQRILDAFPGKVIPADMRGDVEVRDILGATVEYCRARRYLKIHMADAINKLLKKYQMTRFLMSQHLR